MAYVQISIEQLQPLGQETGPSLLTSRPLDSPRYDQAVAGAGTDLIDRSHLPEEQFPLGLVQLQTVYRQQRAVII